jgi:hypothetical protein
MCSEHFGWYNNRPAMITATFNNWSGDGFSLRHGDIGDFKDMTGAPRYIAMQVWNFVQELLHKEEFRVNVAESEGNADAAGESQKVRRFLLNVQP